MAKHILSRDENVEFEPENIVVGDTIETVGWIPMYGAVPMSCEVEVTSIYRCGNGNTTYFGVLHDGKEKIFTPFGFYEKEV